MEEQTEKQAIGSNLLRPKDASPSEGFSTPRSRSRIFYCPYTLTSPAPLGRSSGPVRHGALLRVETAGGAFGYADVHPWEELGDLPLGQQLSKLSQGETTNLTRASLAFAELDAIARTEGRSLWEGLIVPPSHFLLPGAADAVPGALERALTEGFTRFKLKVGGDRDAEERLLRSLAGVLADAGGQLRLDYNERLTASAFAARFARLQDLLPALGFVEDPCPFNADVWPELSRQTGAEFALDRAAGSHGAQFAGTLIHKPARFGPESPRTSAGRVVVTTYLDHPLGQLGAAWVAAHLAPGETHGLVSHRAYARNAFSDLLGWHGPHLTLPGGTGFGFDDELARLDWKPLP